ncbi:MAG: hypothetical protein ACD_32C00122G0001 [uncultured bacterium]|nr:MAG: hypothetical protein ACD_32C00122G0001 [uncultured bacterium]
MPAFSKIAFPLPFTFGLGSRVQQTTFLIPALIIASVQGGVLPK